MGNNSMCCSDKQRDESAEVTANPVSAFKPNSCRKNTTKGRTTSSTATADWLTIKQTGMATIMQGNTTEPIKATRATIFTSMITRFSPGSKN